MTPPNTDRYGRIIVSVLQKGIENRREALAIHLGIRPRRMCYRSLARVRNAANAKKSVNVERFYNTDRLRPKFESFQMTPLFIMTSDAI